MTHETTGPMQAQSVEQELSLCLIEDYGNGDVEWILSLYGSNPTEEDAINFFGDYDAARECLNLLRFAGKDRPLTRSIVRALMDCPYWFRGMKACDTCVHCKLRKAADWD